MSERDRAADEEDIDLEMVSQQRGFRSVARLKRWLARRLSSDD